MIIWNIDLIRYRLLFRAKIYKNLFQSPIVLLYFGCGIYSYLNNSNVSKYFLRYTDTSQ